jgi:hypothetical protein
MRVIPATLHRVLDFGTVVAFALAPSILGLSGPAATLAYLLAVVHLAMTLLTRFSPGLPRPVPLRLHGAVELMVGVALLVLPWLLHWRGLPRTFYVVAGAAILAVWALSRYGQPREAASM